MLRKILCLSLFVSTGASAQTCKNYIENEWVDARYTIGVGTVTDKQTNLMWKKCLIGSRTEDCTSGGSHHNYTWEQALSVAEDYSRVGFAGYHGWRLPNINELASLVAYNCVNPARNMSVMPGTIGSGGVPRKVFHWSSTPTPILSQGIQRIRVIDAYNGSKATLSIAGVGQGSGQYVFVRLVRTAN